LLTIISGEYIEYCAEHYTLLNSTDNISEIESCNKNVRLKNVTFQLGMSISKSEALLEKVWTTCTIRRRKQKE
jgi:hypothetical protein